MAKLGFLNARGGRLFALKVVTVQGRYQAEMQKCGHAVALYLEVMGCRIPLDSLPRNIASLLQYSGPSALSCCLSMSPAPLREMTNAQCTRDSNGALEWHDRMPHAAGQRTRVALWECHL